MKDYLIEGIEKIGCKYSKDNISKMMEYLKILIEYNSHTNLTAIRDEKSIIEKHFLDSLLLQQFIPKQCENAIDVGTGAGFPGMILGIFNPDIKFCLMDSVGKKTTFLKEVKEKLHLPNIEVVNSRAEDHINGNREKYDLGLCRGVAKLSTIIEYVVPFLKVDGTFLPQKMDDSEVKTSSNALKVLKCKLVKVNGSYLPYSKEKRVIIEIKKMEKTPEAYPRRSGIPTKKPL